MEMREFLAMIKKVSDEMSMDYLGYFVGYSFEMMKGALYSVTRKVLKGSMMVMRVC